MHLIFHPAKDAEFGVLRAKSSQPGGRGGTIDVGRVPRKGPTAWKGQQAMITDVNWTKGLIVVLHSPELSCYTKTLPPDYISKKGRRYDIPKIFIRVVTKPDLDYYMNAIRYGVATFLGNQRHRPKIDLRTSNLKCRICKTFG